MVSDAVSLQERTWAQAAAKEKRKTRFQRRRPNPDPNLLQFILEKKRFKNDPERAMRYAEFWTKQLGREVKEALFIDALEIPEELQEAIPPQIRKVLEETYMAAVLTTDERSWSGKMIDWFRYGPIDVILLLPMVAVILSAVLVLSGLIHEDTGRLIDYFTFSFMAVREVCTVPWMAVHGPRWGIGLYLFLPGVYLAGIINAGVHLVY
jgi:hypothetical protein